MDMGSGAMSESQIPSKDDYARASAYMRSLDRGLSDTRDKVKERFKDAGLYELFVFYSPSKKVFVAHVFFGVEEEKVLAEESGRIADIRSAILEELVRAGRGNRESIAIRMNVDTHENVVANFEGNYHLRLR